MQCLTLNSLRSKSMDWFLYDNGLCHERVNITKAQLELISDPNKYIFFEKGMKGKFFVFLIDMVKPTISIWSLITQNKNQNIIYLDANNLYGHVISKFLPTSWFKWIDPKELDLNKYTSNSSKGCVLQVILNILNSYENCTMIIV